MSTSKEKDKNYHAGHRERLKKKVDKYGLETLDRHEVLELLLFYCVPRVDTNELAHKLINEYGSLANVLEADPTDLEKSEGLNENKAFFLNLIPRISRYYLRNRWSERPLLKDSMTLGSYICDLFSGEKNELFYVVSLDSQCRVIKADLLGKGVVNEINVHLRAIANSVLKNNAASVVLAHNHPGGSVVASREDIETTKEVMRLLSMINVKMIDHLIVSGSRFSSMKNKGLVGVAQSYNFNEPVTIFDDINGDWNFDDYKFEE